MSSPRVLLPHERALAQRADEDFKQLGIHRRSGGIGDAREEELVELGREDRLDAQEPHARVGECGAFYGILLGHDDRPRRPGSFSSAALVGVMVGEGDAARGDAERARGGRRSAPDCRCRRSPTTERPRAASANSAGEQLLVARRARTKRSPPRRIANWRWRRARRRAVPAVHDHRIDLAQARDGLAQRPRGQRQPVAEAPLAVDHRDLDVARERVVLQAVVAHEHVDLGMRFEQRARRGGPVGRDVDRHARAPRDQHRLVAEMLGRRDVGIDAHHARADRARARGTRP